MIELNSKQRKILEKAAHDLQPVVIVGGAGMTDGVIKMIDDSLKSHELIKVKFNEYKDEKQELTAEVCQKCDATLVRIIGNVSILYREAEKEEDRRFNLA
ncbi:MAG: ribosome assembly RNA-binding protein YhbY [Treponema sp.]|nr:ribosome assembly RNA-binding protein YhbY [Treponema sp.]